MSVLELARVTRSYRRGPETITPLRGIRLTVEPGELVVVTGPSGSGKTTLLNVAAGWERPDAGAVVIAGVPDPEHAPWQVVGLVPQRLGLLHELTVAENVAWPLWLDGVPAGDREPRVTGLLQRLDLAQVGARRPAETSLGQQQRAALARAVVSGPALLIADEPTGHQDEAATTVVVELVVEAARGGVGCLVASHDEMVLDVADRILALAAGDLTTV